MKVLSYVEMRENMVAIAQEMWTRRLTNAAGGNFAVKVEEDRVLISPSMMSEVKQCKLNPEDILLIDFEQNIIEGVGVLSRESAMHLKLLSNFENVEATIHAHPFYCMPYINFGKPIASVSEATMGRGDVECIPYTKAYSPKLSDVVLEHFLARRELVEKKPMAAIMTKHGVIISGPTLYATYSMLERIEGDAYSDTVKQFI